MNVNKKPFIKKDAGNVEYNAQVFNNSTALAEDREEITLEELVDNLTVEAPAYRGARMPKFNPNAINESRIPDNMRFKEYDIRIEDNKVNLYWKTQEPFDSEDAKKFIKEIKRAFSTIAKTYDYRDSFTVELLVETRDGREYGYATESFEVNGQVSESWRDGEFTRKDLDSYIKGINDKVDIIKYSLEVMAKKHPEFSKDIIAAIEEIRDRFSNIIDNIVENKKLN